MDWEKLIENGLGDGGGHGGIIGKFLDAMILFSFFMLGSSYLLNS